MVTEFNGEKSNLKRVSSIHYNPREHVQPFTLQNQNCFHPDLGDRIYIYHKANFAQFFLKSDLKSDS